MRNSLIEHVESSQLKSDLPEVAIGDTVAVHVRIVEGEKERIQVFEGVVIAMKGEGLNRRITVRRIVANEGVERIFPIHSPKIAKIEVMRHSHVRRSKLFFLRERIGKSRRLRDRRRGLYTAASVVEETPAQTAPPAAESPAAKAPPADKA